MGQHIVSDCLQPEYVCKILYFLLYSPSDLKTLVFFFVFIAIQKTHLRDSTEGIVVKNLLANAEDMGSIPRLGRFHMPWSN